MAFEIFGDLVEENADGEYHQETISPPCSGTEMWAPRWSTLMSWTVAVREFTVRWID